VSIWAGRSKGYERDPCLNENAQEICVADPVSFP
jgi:hypothetical protein